MVNACEIMSSATAHSSGRRGGRPPGECVRRYRLPSREPRAQDTTTRRGRSGEGAATPCRQGPEGKNLQPRHTIRRRNCRLAPGAGTGVRHRCPPRHSGTRIRLKRPYIKANHTQPCLSIAAAAVPCRRGAPTCACRRATVRPAAKEKRPLDPQETGSPSRLEQRR